MKKQYIRVLSFVLFTIVYLMYITTIDYQNLADGYRVTILLPILFIVCFHTLLWHPTLNIKSPYFVMYSVIAFVRFVVLSILTVENGDYSGLSGIPVTEANLNLAGILMMWELLCSSLFLNYWSRKNFNKTIKEAEYYSNANSTFYFLFVLFSLLLIFIFPQSRQGISFFGDITYALNDEFDSLINLGIREIFVTGKYFLLFFVVISLQKNNGIDFKRNKLLSYLTILIAVVFIIGIRVGSNRKKMISDAIASLLLLWNLFPKYKKPTATIISLIGLILVAWTTVARGMAESTSDFLSSYFNLDTFQTYFLGQYNIGIALEAKEIFGNEITAKSLMFGFLRPIFGIGSLIKDIDVTYVEELFDARMSMGIIGFRGDQILPMIAEGYMFFGFFFSSIFSILTVRLGVFFDKIFVHTKNIEVLYISSLISFYLAQAMILNSTIILNMLTFRLAIYFPVYWLGKKMLKKKTYLYESSNIHDLI